jgi:hypothetical protein
MHRWNYKDFLRQISNLIWSLAMVPSSRFSKNEFQSQQYDLFAIGNRILASVHDQST